jgi:hypothetical protein
MAKEAPLTINHIFAGIAVADYDSALAWYTRFFGRPPDVIVAENESISADLSNERRSGVLLLTMSIHSRC